LRDLRRPHRADAALTLKLVERVTIVAAHTQIYTHLDFQHLAKVYDAAHLRAKRKT
jgi:site-specific recombinase XerC